MAKPAVKSPRGTREWSDHSLNCSVGCSHGCLYCYAREAAVRFGRVSSPQAWEKETVRPGAACGGDRRYSGRVMFPTAHDVTRANVKVFFGTLVTLLERGNDVLVVSKPEPFVVPMLRAAWLAAGGRGNLELRVSLTHTTKRVGDLWEPGAPTADARFQAIEAAGVAGLPMSVSIEPLLEPWIARQIVVDAMCGSATGEIWIGACNDLRRRTRWCADRPEVVAAIRELEEWQTPDRMREVFESLMALSSPSAASSATGRIRWKDSYQRALGIDKFGGETGKGDR